MRTLTAAAQTVNSSLYRQYRFKVYLYDLLADGAPTMAAIIASTADTSYRLEVTEFVADGLTITEPGDRRASQVSLTLVDRTDRFNPLGGADARFLRPGCLVRVLEGDAALDEADWTWTATCHIRGQSGFSFDRAQVVRQTDVSAYGRRATPRYLKQSFISPTYGRNVDYGTVCTAIARTQMALTDSEFSRVDATLGKVTQFASQSVVEMTPLEAIDKILETVTKVADFDGAGILRYYSRDVTRAADKIYNNLQLVTRLSIPAADSERFNSVSVTGLDKNITESEQPNETLARVTTSAGFWRPRHTIKVSWSRDRSTRAKDTYLVVETSINSGLMLAMGTESYEALSDFDGQIRIDISDYIAGLLSLITVTLGVSAAVGDWVPAIGANTQPIGKILEAVVLQEITMMLATICTAQYEIRGTVLIPVYKEFSVVVTDANVPDYLLNQQMLSNDWINDQTDALEIAQRELLFEHAVAEPRSVSVLNDLELEIGDILYLPVGGGLRLWIEGFRKTLSRGEVPVMEIAAYRAL